MKTDEKERSPSPEDSPASGRRGTVAQDGNWLTWAHHLGEEKEQEEGQPWAGGSVVAESCSFVAATYPRVAIAICWEAEVHFKGN